MLVYIQLCMLIFVLSEGVYSEKCKSCINYKRCPAALTALNKKRAEALRLFSNAHCGFDIIGGSSQEKICCSMFSPVGSIIEVEKTTVRNEETTKVIKSEAIDEETTEDDPIANHENLRLLPDKCGVFKGDRIVGGDVAEIYEFPWMALISYKIERKRKFLCGGSIINKRYILTAGHCVHRQSIIGVRVGEYDLSNRRETHTQDVLVEKTILHDKYHGLPKIYNDIALIRLASDIDFTYMSVDRICLPTTSRLRRRTLFGETATATGWGLTELGTKSHVLRKVDIPILRAEQCSSLYNRFSRLGEPDVTADQLCAGSQNKDSCNGDSGGPLMLKEKYRNVTRYIQYGVVSHGPHHCGSDYPGVYTDVTKYMGWILDNITA